MNTIDKNFGINKQALSVLAFMPEYWPFATSDDHIQSTVRPWYNGRESGVVISLRSKKGEKYLHIAWFENRNTDALCALKWKTNYLYWNHPLENENIFDIAYDGDHHEVHYGEVGKMADWILDEFERFYKAE